MTDWHIPYIGGELSAPSLVTWECWGVNHDMNHLPPLTPSLHYTNSYSSHSGSDHSTHLSRRITVVWGSDTKCEDNEAILTGILKYI